MFCIFSKNSKYFDILTHHIILWKLKDELSEAQKLEIKKNIKEGLEGLAGKIPGLLSIKVNIEGLQSSNVDLMLDSTFDSPRISPASIP